MATWPKTGQLASRRLNLGQISAPREEDSFLFLLYQSLRGLEAWAAMAILSLQQEDLWEPILQKTEPRKEILSSRHHLSIWISQCLKPAYPMDFYTTQYIFSFSWSLSDLGVLSLLGIIYPNIKQYGWFQCMIPVKSVPLLYSHILLLLYHVLNFLKRPDQCVIAFHPDHSYGSFPTSPPCTN